MSCWLYAWYTLIASFPTLPTNPTTAPTIAPTGPPALPSLAPTKVLVATFPAFSRILNAIWKSRLLSKSSLNVKLLSIS